MNVYSALLADLALACAARSPSASAAPGAQPSRAAPAPAPSPQTPAPAPATASSNEIAEVRGSNQNQRPWTILSRLIAIRAGRIVESQRRVDANRR